MNDDRIERLLRGYELPEVSRALDQRVLAQAERVLAEGPEEPAAVRIVRAFGDALGFGYLNYVLDFVTATDAEYRVDLI